MQSAIISGRVRVQTMTLIPTIGVTIYVADPPIRATPPGLVGETERTERGAGGFRQHRVPLRRGTPPDLRAEGFDQRPDQPPAPRDERAEVALLEDPLRQHAVETDTVAEHAGSLLARRPPMAMPHIARRGCRR